MLVNSLLISLFYLVGCTKSNDPEKTLKEFVEYSFSENQKKSFYLENTAGLLKEKIVAMSDDDIKKFFNVTDLQKRTLLINQRKCSADTCFFTYTLTYNVNQDKQTKFEMEVNKIAELQRVGKKWVITNILNVKTSIDSKLPIIP